jgi:transposase-like protein
MATIFTTCPNTGRAVSTGIETDAESFAAMPDVLTRVHCPHCGEQHNWSKYNAVLRDTAPKCAPGRSAEQ